MNETQELTVVPQPMAVAVPDPTPADMLRSIMQVMERGNVTQDGVAAVVKMVELCEHMEDRNAEKQYASALGLLQKECQNVVATKDVDGKFRYAPFLDIWNHVRPAVERNNFTLQWSQQHMGDKIVVTLTLQHTPTGCKHDFTYGMRLGSNAPGTPAGSQLPVLDSITESRAKRRLLMDALNIVVDAVTPAEDVGDGTLATDAETDALFKRLLALEPEDEKRKASERRFLALAGVSGWNLINKAAMPILQRLMSDKERAAARKGAA